MANTKRAIKKVEFIFSNEQMQLFIDKLSDLSAIDDYIVLKFNNNDLLLYTVATSAEDKMKKNILAFKSYKFNTNEIIKIKGDFEDNLIYIIKDAKKTIRTLRNFNEFNENVECTITYDELNEQFFGDNIKFKNSKLKLNFQGGSPRDSNTKITLGLIQDKSLPEFREFKFFLKKEDFLQAKKLSLIESENDIIYFNVINNELMIAENRWSLKIEDVNFEDTSISIMKKYFKSATCEGDGIDIEVFPAHLIFNNKKSSLMISRQMSAY
jgi:hypothetical protein